MYFCSPFALDSKQRSAISVEDLARHVLKVLQHQFKAPREPVSYGSGCLPGIYEREIFAMSDPHERADRAFQQKWAEAVQYLRNKNLIINDPGQNCDEFVLLTEAGRQQSSDGVIVGVSSANAYLESIERAAGPLDPVIRQYLQESYRAFDQDLLLSATFMLGAASERALFLSADAVDALLDDKKQRSCLNDLRRAREVKEWILSNVPALRKKGDDLKPLLADIQDKIDTLFTLYRYQRNEVGHPRDEELVTERPKIKAMLESFGLYLAACTAIIRKAKS